MVMKYTGENGAWDQLCVTCNKVWFLLELSPHGPNFQSPFGFSPQKTGIPDTKTNVEHLGNIAEITKLLTPISQSRAV